MRAIQFGAGGIGRGFIGHLLHEVGYSVTFVDIDEVLVRNLNERGEYRIRLAKEGYPEVQIQDVSGLLAGDREAVCEAVAQADLACTAVGAHALQAIAPLLAGGMEARAERGSAKPLNVLVFENVPHASTVVRRMVSDSLPADRREELGKQMGCAGVVVGRMIPVLPPSWREKDPLLVVAEDYSPLPVEADGIIPPAPCIKSLILAEDFEAEEGKKLYIHNAGHAAAAYHGYLAGHETMAEAALDPAVEECARRSMEESCKGLACRHGLDEFALTEYAAQLVDRFRNPYLMDTIKRVGRDPLRKLGREDRLVGAARMVLEAGIEPRALCGAIAACLRFDPETDSSAVELQNRIREQGVATVLREVCGLEDEDPLHSLVIRAWEGDL